MHSSPQNHHTLRKIKILQISILVQLVMVCFVIIFNKDLWYSDFLATRL